MQPPNQGSLKLALLKGGAGECIFTEDYDPQVLESVFAFFCLGDKDQWRFSTHLILDVCITGSGILVKKWEKCNWSTTLLPNTGQTRLIEDDHKKWNFSVGVFAVVPIGCWYVPYEVIALGSKCLTPHYKVRIETKRSHQILHLKGL
jgi:hypothetical protein